MITQSVLEKVAKLSKLGLTPEESVTMTTEIEKIINYFEQIRNLDLKTVSPMTHAIVMTLRPRPDEIRAEKCIINYLPYIKHNYFYVPAVLE